MQVRGERPSKLPLDALGLPAPVGACRPHICQGVCASVWARVSCVVRCVYARTCVHHARAYTYVCNTSVCSVGVRVHVRVIVRVRARARVCECVVTGGHRGRSRMQSKGACFWCSP